VLVGPEVLCLRPFDGSNLAAAMATERNGRPCQSFARRVTFQPEQLGDAPEVEAKRLPGAVEPVCALAERLAREGQEGDDGFTRLRQDRRRRVEGREPAQLPDTYTQPAATTIGRSEARLGNREAHHLSKPRGGSAANSARYWATAPSSVFGRSAVCWRALASAACSGAVGTEDQSVSRELEQRATAGGRVRPRSRAQPGAARARRPARAPAGRRAPPPSPGGRARPSAAP
jgi:hypothetical protein